MNAIVRVIAILISAIWSVNASASTVVLDFEGLPASVTGVTFYTPVLHNGFYIDPALASLGAVISEYPPDLDSTSLLFCGYCINGTQGASIYSATSEVFELDSLDITSVIIGPYGQVTGHLAGGGTITQAIGPLNGTVLFDSSWTNLTSIDIEFEVYEIGVLGAVAGIDNVVMQTVPLPAAVWLFMSGIAILGWTRRLSR